MGNYSPGSYVMLDNLKKFDRLIINANLQYDSHSKDEGMYIKYVYIFTLYGSVCIDQWNMNLIELTPDLNEKLEWGEPEIKYSFDDALKNKKLTLNSKEKTYYDYVSDLKNSRKLRKIVFKHPGVKILKKINISDNISIEFRLTNNEDVPQHIDEFNLSDHLNLKYRILCNVNLDKHQSLSINFDRGMRRMLPKPNGWYPTKNMEGALISEETAFEIDKITYIKPI
jgi:hypothetical protein